APCASSWPVRRASTCAGPPHEATMAARARRWAPVRCDGARHHLQRRKSLMPTRSSVLSALGAAGAAAGSLAAYDLLQRKHSGLRNYPVLGHMRYLLEGIRPELQQYFIERNWDGRPYDRDTRSIIYQRAKGIQGEQAFGTERDVNRTGYEYLVHTVAPVEQP